MMISPESVFYSAYRFQVLGAIVANLIGFAHGIGLGWVSPILSLLQSDSPDSPFDTQITVGEASWVGSLIGLGCFTGTFIIGIIIDHIGRKPVLLLIAIPNICSWIIIYFAKNVTYLYVARFLAGTVGGGMYVVIPIYVAEIADNKIRGRLGSLFTLNLSVGIVIGFVLASYLNYYIIPCLVVILPLLYFVMVLFFPETPRHLLMRGHEEKAENSLKFYRNFKSTTKEDNEKFQQDFLELKAAIQATKTEGNSLSIKDFFTRRSLKAMGLGLVLMMLDQFCGVFAIINYSSTIFANSGSDIDPNTNTIVIGMIQVLGTYTSTFFVDKFGRKILLLISSGGMCLGLTASGVHSYLLAFSNQDMSHLSWVPLVTISFVIFIGNIGVLSVTFVILVEILPSNIRSIGSTICLMSLSLISFGYLKMFPILLAEIDFYGVMWMCAGSCAVGFIFIAIFLPETKGKSLDAEATVK